jgi:uncharacterized protein YdbL (DUF1318 family)
MRNGNIVTICVAAATCAALAACGPIQTENKVVIEQPKPLEINVNLSGKLELVITDARQDLEAITGEKPKREVKPEDIGLPTDTVPGSAAPAPSVPVALLSTFSADPNGSATTFIAASEADLVASLKARHAAVRQLLSAKLVGEAHTGLLVEKGALSTEQAATVSAENADRTALYAARAAKNKTTTQAAALAYYLERLGYAEKGDWVEIFNKKTKQWDWTQWAG